MVAQPQPPRWSVDEYLEMERASSVKHEYLDGHVYAMAGGTRRHNRIAVNLLTVLTTYLRGHSCQVGGPDLKIRIDVHNYVYPDASVTCDPSDLADESSAYFTAPCLVVEVPSDASTAGYDRGDKFDLLYRRLSSLHDYVLVETSSIGVEVRRKGEDGVWAAARYGPGDTVLLDSVGGAFPIEMFYL